MPAWRLTMAGKVEPLHPGGRVHSQDGGRSTTAKSTEETGCHGERRTPVSHTFHSLCSTSWVQAALMAQSQSEKQFLQKGIATERVRVNAFHYMVKI